MCVLNQVIQQGFLGLSETRLKEIRDKNRLKTGGRYLKRAGKNALTTQEREARMVRERSRLNAVDRLTELESSVLPGLGSEEDLIEPPTPGAGPGSEQDLSMPPTPGYAHGTDDEEEVEDEATDGNEDPDDDEYEDGGEDDDGDEDEEVTEDEDDESE